ncbi:MAG: secretin N-terminal domain-containing protein [Myxococcaceae bacterium]
MRTFLLAVVLVAVTALGAQKKKVTFEFQRADVHEVLRLLAEVKKVNLMVADDVQGRVTLRLVNVTADDAFDAVLASQGLGVETKGTIVRVATIERLAQEAKARADLVHQQEIAGELQTTFIPVSYASADQMAPLVKAQLSERGTVTVDERTNTLIVRDIKR